MKPLYLQSDYDQAKSYDTLPLECYYCHSTFLKKKSYITASLNGDTRTPNKYCTKSCNRLAHSAHHPTKVSCEQCGVLFMKSHSQILCTKHNFCGKSCAATYHNKHKTTGTR